MRTSVRRFKKTAGECDDLLKITGVLAIYWHLREAGSAEYFLLR